MGSIEDVPDQAFKATPKNDQFWKSIQDHKARDRILDEAVKHVESHKLKAQGMQNGSAFDRNLEEVLDQRRSSQNLATLHRWDHAVDFSSNDFLSHASNGILREEFLKEIARYPDFRLGSTGSRLLDGNNPYCEALEEEIATFHGAETAVLVRGRERGAAGTSRQMTLLLTATTELYLLLACDGLNGLLLVQFIHWLLLP